MGQAYRLGKDLSGHRRFFRPGAVNRDSFDAYLSRQARLHTRVLTCIVNIAMLALVGHASRMRI
jgi:hypothetical protein